MSDESRTTLVSVDGIRAGGRHGANPGERDQPQEFMIDVDVWVEVGRDSLESTIDYRDIAAAVREVVRTQSYVLLEALAEAVAAAVLPLGAITRVRAVVHKPAAARSLDADDVAAEVTLEA